MSSNIPRIARLEARFKAQLLSLVALNSYVWSPMGKAVCLPVLNCHACTLSATSCPVGTITAFALIRRLPYYVIGVLGLIGLLVGRAFCGWLCPFGFLQDALYRLPSRKLRLPSAANWLKYALLAGLVIAVPLALGAAGEERDAIRIVDESAGALDYCALVCPAGTLTAGVPGLIVREDLRESMSWKSWSKLGLLALVLGLAVVSRRSFCRGLCPLGALMAIASWPSVLRLATDPGKCTHCDTCRAVCPTDSRCVPSSPGEREATAECVMCLDCVRQCPEPGALSARLGGRTVMSSAAPRPRRAVQETG